MSIHESYSSSFSTTACVLALALNLILVFSPESCPGVLGNVYANNTNSTVVYSLNLVTSASLSTNVDLTLPAL